MDGEAALIPWDDLRIRKWPDDCLVVVSLPIEEEMGLEPLADALHRFMDHPNGVGLSAPQLGIHARAIAVNYKGEKFFIANPEIVKRSVQMTRAREECLSFPGKVADVKRNKRVIVAGFDEYWKPTRRRASGWMSRIIQHEIDHLDGITMMDRAGRFKRTPNVSPTIKLPKPTIH